MAGRRILVVEEGGEVAGFAELEEDGHLDMLYVRKDAVGRGVGRRLYGRSSGGSEVEVTDGTSLRLASRPALSSSGKVSACCASIRSRCGGTDDELRDGEAAAPTRQRRGTRHPVEPQEARAFWGVPIQFHRFEPPGRSRGTTAPAPARSKRTSVGPSSSWMLKRSLFSVRIGTITHVLPIGR
jgi:GNAT superfamily N-acetyltransferase